MLIVLSVSYPIFLSRFWVVFSRFFVLYSLTNKMLNFSTCQDSTHFHVILQSVVCGHTKNIVLKSILLIIMRNMQNIIFSYKVNTKKSVFMEKMTNLN